MDFHILSMANLRTTKKKLNTDTKKEAVRILPPFGITVFTAKTTQRNEPLTELIDDLSFEDPHSLAHYFVPIEKWYPPAD